MRLVRNRRSEAENIQTMKRREKGGILRHKCLSLEEMMILAMMLRIILMLSGRHMLCRVRFLGGDRIQVQLVNKLPQHDSFNHTGVNDVW